MQKLNRSKSLKSIKTLPSINAIKKDKDQMSSLTSLNQTKSLRINTLIKNESPVKSNKVLSPSLKNSFKSLFLQEQPKKIDPKFSSFYDKNQKDITHEDCDRFNDFLQLYKKNHPLHSNLKNRLPVKKLIKEIDIMIPGFKKTIYKLANEDDANNTEEQKHILLLSEFYNVYVSFHLNICNNYLKSLKISN